uniref:Cobalamin biosynthesis protein n=1 Tax=Dictyoglomus thermophilum TaxID=14 RepID=A0A7C3MPX9_DICTH
MYKTKKLFIGIFILVLLSPLGILLPYFFRAGSAWGEWGPDELKEMIGYVPKDLERLSSFWNPVFPDYNLKSWIEKGLFYEILGYLITGLIGTAIVIIVTYLIIIVNKKIQK